MNIRRFALALLLAISTPALAHHDPGHGVIAIGVETETVVRALVCDTQDAAQLITAVHRERGLDLAMAVVAELQATPSAMHRGEPLCGVAAGHMTVHEQYSAEILPGVSYVTYLVRISMRESPGRIFFALITADEILPASRADELTAKPA